MKEKEEEEKRGNMIGCNEQKEYFKRALQSNRLSHSYLFQGIKGVGKMTFALHLAAQIVCECPVNGEACGECVACQLSACSSHPDIIKVEKDGKTIKVDTVREKVVKELSIKPYRAKRKVIIVEDADCMGIEAQNAILKSIEEPVGFATIILVSQNNAKLIETILSRCIAIRFNPNTKEEILQYLEEKGLSEDQKRLCAMLSNGSIGQLVKLLEDDVYWELRKDAISYFKRLLQGNLFEILQLAKEICSEDKEAPLKNFEFWKLILRDILFIQKGLGEKLYFYDRKEDLIAFSKLLEKQQLKDINDLLQQSMEQLKTNAKSLFVYDTTFLKIRRLLN